MVSENWLLVQVNPHAHVKIGSEHNVIGVREVRVAGMAQVQTMWFENRKADCVREGESEPCLVTWSSVIGSCAARSSRR